MTIGIVNGASTFWLCQGPARGLERLVGPLVEFAPPYGQVVQDLQGLRAPALKFAARGNAAWTGELRCEHERSTLALAEAWRWDWPPMAIAATGTLTFTESGMVRTSTNWIIQSVRVTRAGVRNLVAISLKIGGPLTIVTG